MATMKPAAPSGATATSAPPTTFWGTYNDVAAAFADYDAWAAARATYAVAGRVNVYATAAPAAAATSTMRGA